MNRNNHSDIIPRMFLSAAVAMIFTQVAGVAAQIIDGIITSRELGPDPYSAVSLLHPFITVILLAAAFISTGNQILCSTHVGTGRKKEANAVFSLAAVTGIGAACVFVLACVCVPDIIFRICGVSADTYPELYPGMREYLRGYLFGIPALILIQVVGPVIVMDNGKIKFTVSAFLLCAVDVAGDLLNVFVFRGGPYGMGLATAISFNVQLLFLLTHFMKKNAYFSFSFGGIRFSNLKAVAKAGSPTLVQRAAITLRDLFVNRINLMVALSTAAVAARGLQNDLNLLLFCVGLGIGKTLVSMTGVYFGANDRQGLKRLFSCAMRISVTVSGVIGLAVFLSAPLLAGLYTRDPDVLSLGVFSIRCMAVGLIMDVLSCAFIDYLQGIRNRRLVNILNITDRFFLPVLSALVLGLTFGSRGIMASVAVGKLLLILVMVGIILFRNRRFPRSWEDCMLLPDDFGGTDSDNLYAAITSMEDVITESRKAEEFCLRHGTDRRTANLMGLFVEELAGNIIRHGKSRRNQKPAVDFRLSVNDSRIILSLRDYLQEFDPTAYYAAHHNEGPEEMPGIRIVTELAEEIRYYNAFNSNNIIVCL